MRVLAFLCAATACLAAPLTPLEMQQRMGLGINLGNRIDLYNTTAREVRCKCVLVLGPAGPSTNTARCPSSVDALRALRSRSLTSKPTVPRVSATSGFLCAGTGTPTRASPTSSTPTFWTWSLPTSTGQLTCGPCRRWPDSKLELGHLRHPKPDPTAMT